MEWRDYTFAEAVENIANSLRSNAGSAKFRSSEYIHQLFVSIGGSIPEEWQSETKVALRAKKLDLDLLDVSITNDLKRGFYADRFAVMSAIRSLACVARELLEASSSPLTALEIKQTTSVPYNS